MPKSRVRKKNGKKVKYQAPKKKQFSMKELQRLTELLKKMQIANPQEISGETIENDPIIENENPEPQTQEDPNNK